MAGEKRTLSAGIREDYEEEIEDMIRQVKIDGGSLDGCVAKLHFAGRLRPFASRRPEKYAAESGASYRL
jgi:hypothetical protein